MSVAFDREACRRLPLAEAALRLLDYATDEVFLRNVFTRHRGPSYEDTLTFPTFVRLIADALLGHRGPSAHQTFRQAQDIQALEVSVQAVYGKLRRVPLELSLGLFVESAARLREVAPPVVANPLPQSLAAFWCLGFDGKKLKHVARRLKPLRGLTGGLFGGKLLVVQDLATQQAVAVHAVADGEAADNPLVPPVVARVRTLSPSRPRLWVGDRAFCDFTILHELAVGCDHFVIRFRGTSTFFVDDAVPSRTGIDADGRWYREEWGWLGKATNPRRVRVRRITVPRPNSDAFVLVTSLENADGYPARDLLTLYRSRWEIETMFQRVVQTFNLRHLIGGTPRATVFQAVLCLLLYNMTLVIRDTVAAGGKQEPKAVSLDRLFDATLRDLTAWLEVIGVEATPTVLRTLRMQSGEDLRRYLRTILGRLGVDRWTKPPPRPRPPKPSARAYVHHTSVDKVLRGVHREIPLRPSPKTNPRTGQTRPPFQKEKHD